MSHLYEKQGKHDINR